MDPSESRLSQEAREAKRRAAEVEARIENLSRQIANPAKHFSRQAADPLSESSAERFRKYFSLNRVGVNRRKPTRAEMRAHRARTLAWVALASILLMIVLFKLFGILLG